MIRQRDIGRADGAKGCEVKIRAAGWSSLVQSLAREDKGPSSAKHFTYGSQCWNRMDCWIRVKKPSTDAEEGGSIFETESKKNAWTKGTWGRSQEVGGGLFRLSYGQNVGQGTVKKKGWAPEVLEEEELMRSGDSTVGVGEKVDWDCFEKRMAARKRMDFPSNMEKAGKTDEVGETSGSRNSAV